LVQLWEEGIISAGVQVQNNMEKNNYYSDMRWLSGFLVRTTDAESVSALSSIVTKQLTQVLPFTYVSVFFLGFDSNLYLIHEAGNSIKNANLLELSVNAIFDIHEWPCALNKLVSNREHEMDPYAFDIIKDLLCEPIKSKQRIVAMLCYRLENEELPVSKRIILDLAALQISLSFDRIIKEQRMMYGSACRMNENGGVEKIILQSDRQSCMAEMALGVADGIRNPITVIGGIIKRVSKKIDFDPAVQKDWGILLEEAARLERLVRDFEDLAHKREIILELRDMNEVIAKSVEVFKNDFLRGRRREFKLNLSRDRCLVKIDEKLIATALTHLFINSVEATDENGIIHISTNIIGERIIIDMTDNGIGIPAEFLERIFEPFLSTKPGGTGLGLTYVQQIFKEHRGEIKVEGRQGKGTSITISLPRSGGMEI